MTKELARGALDGLAERTVNHLVQKYGHETLIRASKELLEGTGGEMLEEIGNTANGYLWRAIAGDTQDAPDLHDYAEAAAAASGAGCRSAEPPRSEPSGGSDAPDGRRKAPMSKHPPGMSGKKRPPRRKRAKTPQRKGRRRCRTSPPAGRPE